MQAARGRDSGTRIGMATRLPNCCLLCLTKQRVSIKCVSSTHGSLGSCRSFSGVSLVLGVLARLPVVIRAHDLWPSPHESAPSENLDLIYCITTTSTRSRCSPRVFFLRRPRRGVFLRRFLYSGRMHGFLPKYIE